MFMSITWDLSLSTLRLLTSGISQGRKTFSVSQMIFLLPQKNTFKRMGQMHLRSSFAGYAIHHNCSLYAQLVTSLMSCENLADPICKHLWNGWCLVLYSKLILAMDVDWIIMFPSTCLTIFSYYSGRQVQACKWKLILRLWQ